VSLGDRGIATSEAEKTMAAGAQMWNHKKDCLASQQPS
jgi:hypothetical protein